MAPQWHDQGLKNPHPQSWVMDKNVGTVHQVESTNSDCREYPMYIDELFEEASLFELQVLKKSIWPFQGHDQVPPLKSSNPQIAASQPRRPVLAYSSKDHPFRDGTCAANP